MNVIVDWETFSQGGHDGSVRETADGHPLPPESVARLACDATVQRVILDPNGIPINVGRRHGTATDAQWQAIRAVYRTCAWHGCDRPVSWSAMLPKATRGDHRRCRTSTTFTSGNTVARPICAISSRCVVAITTTFTRVVGR